MNLLTPRLELNDTIVNYYPVKSLIDGNILSNKFLKVVVNNDLTICKRFVSLCEMLFDTNIRVDYGYKVTRNNSNLPQYDVIKARRVT